MSRCMKDLFKVRFNKSLRWILAEITVWTVFYQYFIYKPEEPDENHDCFYLIDLENGNATILIEDFVKDSACKAIPYLIYFLLDKYMAYSHDNFYIASQKEIQVYNIPHDLQPGETVRKVPDLSMIGTISPDDQKIHGLFVNSAGFGKQNFIFVALETDDH